MKYTLLALTLLAPLSIGCSASSHFAQNEVGTPAQRYAGRALVVLPRACVSQRSVPRHHFRENTVGGALTTMTGGVGGSGVGASFAVGGGPIGPGAPEGSYEVPSKTARLQAMLDRLTEKEPLPIGPRPEAECGPRPDLGSDAAYLSQIRATPETLRAMHEGGASHIVVLELHTVLACAQSIPWSANDICHEDEVTITAWMFDEAGAAVWGLTRVVAPTDEPGNVLDRILARVPTTEPLHRTQPEFEIAKGESPTPTL